MSRAKDYAKKGQAKAKQRAARTRAGLILLALAIPGGAWLVIAAIRSGEVPRSSYIPDRPQEPWDRQVLRRQAANARYELQKHPGADPATREAHARKILEFAHALLAEGKGSEADQWLSSIEFFPALGHEAEDLRDDIWLASPAGQKEEREREAFARERGSTFVPFKESKRRTREWQKAEEERLRRSDEAIQKQWEADKAAGRGP